MHPLNKSQKILGHVNLYVKIQTVYFSSLPAGSEREMYALSRAFSTRDREKSRGRESDYESALGSVVLFFVKKTVESLYCILFCETGLHGRTHGHANASSSFPAAKTEK